MSNITQVINVDRFLKMLKKGVHASDMDQVLSSTGPYTIFAPTDLAFEKLDKTVIEKLLEPQHRKDMADLINNHVVSGKIAFDMLLEGTMLTTLNGKQLEVHASGGKITIGDCTITHRESKISNGVMHLSDTVMQ